MKPSKAYLRALEDSKRVAAAGKSFTGKFLRPHAGFIAEIAKRLNCRTVLDYGCGRGEQYSWVSPKGQTLLGAWGNPALTLYDPAFPEFAKEPEGKFDLVICTHCLGTIPKADLPWVIDRLYGFAGKAIYISERLGAPRKVLGDNGQRVSAEWTAKDWRLALSRPTEVEVTLATREIIGAAKITSHATLIWPPTAKAGVWFDVKWPPEVHAWNHENA